MTERRDTVSPGLGRVGYGYLALLLAFASISTDLYIPAMPTMAHAFGASHGSLELTITAYLLGFAIGQLFWGPFSDRRGRRVPLAFGLVLFMIGSLGAGLAQGVLQLILWRVIQALGASASVVIGRAIVADLFHGAQAARVLSNLTAILVLAPMLGPIIGARILDLSSWRMVFFVLAIVGALTLLALPRVIPESLPPPLRQSEVKILDIAAYRSLIGNHRLLTYAMISLVFTAGIFAYVAGSSFVYITWGGLSPDAYALVFGAGAALIAVLSLVNGRVVGRIGIDSMLLIGIIATVATTAGLLVATLLDADIKVFVVLIVLFAGTNGLVGANAISGGLNSVTHGRGRASALLGFMQYGGGMIGSALLGFLANGTPYPLFIIIFLSAVCSLFLIIRLRQLPVQSS